MSSGGSRFKVVPVETRDPYFSPNSKHAIAKPTAVVKKEEIVNRSSRSLSDIHPSSAPSVQQSQLPQPIQKVLPPGITPNPRPVYTVPKVAPTAQVKASTIIQPTVNGQVQVSSDTHISTNGDAKIASSDVSGARRTKRAPLVRAKTVVAASPPAHNPLNIDNKIEQAMDLVKTHLMFAVREEVDGLRGKIFDLENHVRRLEAENAILKRTIPNDTLKQLHLKL